MLVCLSVSLFCWNVLKVVHNIFLLIVINVNMWARVLFPDDMPWPKLVMSWLRIPTIFGYGGKPNYSLFITFDSIKWAAGRLLIQVENMHTGCPNLHKLAWKAKLWIRIKLVNLIMNVNIHRLGLYIDYFCFTWQQKNFELLFRCQPISSNDSWSLVSLTMTCIVPKKKSYCHHHHRQDLIIVSLIRSSSFESD